MKKRNFFLILLLLPKDAFSMHIMEGFLPVYWAAFWWAVILPFLFFGIRNIKKIITENHELKMMLAAAGAFAFVLSALKLPSMTGSCSHPTGVGLGAVMFGPSVMSVLGFIVLLFQALLLAHGGITTLGANTFSMGIAGPLIAFFVFRLCRKIKIKTSVAVFSAAALGDLGTYLVTSAQLAFAHPDIHAGVPASFAKFAGIFAVTQLPLAIIEGIVTVFVYNLFQTYAREEFRGIEIIQGYQRRES